MSLGSGWWGGTWSVNCLPGSAVWSGATKAVYAISDLWNVLVAWDVNYLYTRDLSFGDKYDATNGGMFYIRNKATDELTAAAEVFRMPSSGTAASFLPAPSSSGEIEPFDVSMAVGYTSPFSAYLSAADYADYQVIFTNRPPAATGDTFQIVHHCPWSWHGTASQVIAAILLRLGVASGYIDTTAIDNAYDGETSDHGTAGINKPRIRVFRQCGKPIIETIKRVAAHSWTRIGYTMAGKFACWSATRPTTYAATGLVGVKGLRSWRMTDDHLYNYAAATHGQVCRSTIGGAGKVPTTITSGVEVGNPDYVFKSQWDASLSSARSDRWIDEDSDATSQTAYGLISLGGIDQENEPIPLHYELFQDGAPPYGSTNGVLARVDKFCHPLREVTLTQDLRGLDYEVGTLITAYATGDGATADYFCIEKEIDFNTLTVTSTLLEDL